MKRTNEIVQIHKMFMNCHEVVSKKLQINIIKCILENFGKYLLWTVMPLYSFICIALII